MIATAHAESRVVDVGWGFTAVYAVVGDGGIVLVDSQRPGREDRIVRSLEQHDLDPDRVTAIVVTHGHPDHAGSARALADRLHVPILAGDADRPYLEQGDAGPVHATSFEGRLIAATVPRHFPPITADVWVTEPRSLDVYGVDAVVRQVGGHTPGSVVVALPSGEEVVGDLLRTRLHHRDAPARHWFQDDEPAALAAIATELDRGATTLYVAHRGALAASDVRTWLASDPAHLQLPWGEADTRTSSLGGGAPAR